MTPLQNLHYAIGELAYTIAFADARVQKQEVNKFLTIVANELHNKEYDFDVSEIIFDLMTREKTDVETAYNRAMKDIRLNSHYLSPQLKEKFIKIIEDIAKAYPPVALEEIKIIDRFKKDIAPIHGDPVYYEQVKHK